MATIRRGTFIYIYLGRVIRVEGDRTYMSMCTMAKYIENACRILNLKIEGELRVPINQPIATA